jgi:aminoglycoside phosphotransferase (APT) family kinase protein
MGDAPATKKELAALQKQVDEVRKWFQDDALHKNSRQATTYGDARSDSFSIQPLDFSLDAKPIY